MKLNELERGGGMTPCTPLKAIQTQLAKFEFPEDGWK